MNDEYLIYTLSDPRNGEVRYVGCTANTEKRYYQHLYDSSLSNNARAEWLKELQKEQLGPVMVRIATCNATERDTTERHWIEHFLSLGASLTNTQHNPNISVTRAPGGGRKPLSPQEETKKVAVTLLSSQVEAMEKLGDGNLSAGIRKAIEMTTQLHVESAIERSLGKAGGTGNERFEIRFWISTEVKGRKVESRGTLVTIEKPTVADVRKWMQQIGFTVSSKIFNNQWTATDAKEANAALPTLVADAIAEDVEFNTAFTQEER